MRHRYPKNMMKSEDGSIVVITLIILMLLTVMGISATSTTDIELQIVQNTTLYKQNFYRTEGGSFEVAYDVDKAGGTSGCPSDRPSCSESYAILDVDKPMFLTATTGGATVENPSTTQIAARFDTAWPKNYETQTHEYGYRAFYKGQGPMPKGYGVNFGTYVFDISSRKQSSPSAGATPEDLTTVIMQGFRKIGPKAVI